MRIDWALLQQPSDLRELVTNLRYDGIEVVIPPRKGGGPEDHIYVDHRTQTAVTGQTLGQAYTAGAIHNSLSQGRSQDPSRTPRNIPYPTNHQVKIEGSEFNSRVPQVLSTLFQSLPEPEENQQSQGLGRSYKR